MQVSIKDTAPVIDRLESTYKARVVDGEFGKCVEIRIDYPFETIKEFSTNMDRTKRGLYAKLQLIKGIGPVTENFLKKRRYTSIKDMVFSRRRSWRADAAKLIGWIETNQKQKLAELRQVNDFDLLYCFTPGELAFLDIETTGIQDPRIFLIAIGLIDRRTRLFTIYQLFARDLTEEASVIEHTLSLLKNHGCIVSFNGKSFDIPVLAARVLYYFAERLENYISHHVDLLHESRRIMGLDRKVKLSVLEEGCLDLDREFDVPSGKIPKIYSRYCDTGHNEEILDALNSSSRNNRRDFILQMAKVIHHNMIDVRSLLYIMEILLKRTKFKNNSK